MINDKKAILQYSKPSIILDELSVIDTMKASDPNAVRASRDKREIYKGSLLPIININSYEVKNIEYLKIDMNSEIPELLLVFKTYETQFLYSGYPKDGDLLCLYIRSTSEAYKPIRHDYTIVEVTGPGPERVYGRPESSKSTSIYHKFIVKAQLRIPRLFKNSCKAYSGKSSWETLKDVAKELDLGFSSNEKGTSDNMTWICPSISTYSFIESVVSKSWKTEEDAFEWWIDPYYNLTFVNMNKQLFGPDSNDPEGDTVLANYGPSQDIFGGLDSTQKTPDFEMPLFLTNDPYYSKYPFFVKSYTVGNKSGHVTNKFGYKTIIQFYDTGLVSDLPKNKYTKYPVESVTPKELGENDIILRGRPNEKIYLDESKNNWVGTTYFENTHPNIHQAPLQNLINKVENYKIFLNVELSSFVPWIYRGQVVPVRIVHTEAVDIQSQKGPISGVPVSKPGETELNRFLSGKYIILGTSIEYKEGVLKTILRLGKRQWSINKGIASLPEPITS